MYSWRVSHQSDQSGRLGQDVVPGATEGGASGRGKKKGEGPGQRTRSGVCPSLQGFLEKPRALRDPLGLPAPPRPVTPPGSPCPSPP